MVRLATELSTYEVGSSRQPSHPMPAAAAAGRQGRLAPPGAAARRLSAAPPTTPPGSVPAVLCALRRPRALACK